MLSMPCELIADRKERMSMIIKEKPPLDELIHFGVLGMHWGKRKDHTVSSNKTYKYKGKEYPNKKAIAKKVAIESAITFTVLYLVQKGTDKAVNSSIGKKYIENLLMKNFM